MHINTTTMEAVNLEQLRQKYPHTIFPDQFEGDFEEYAFIHPEPTPEYDAATHKAVEGEPARDDGGVWRQVWGVVELTEQELAARVPQSCTPAQGLVALYAIKGVTEQDILDAIESITDPAQKYVVKIGYQRAITWERQSASMQAMAALLSLSPQDLNDLFSHAYGVQV